MSSKPDIPESGELVIGYHGTSFNAASNILLKGFKSSEGVKHWLGVGVYFYQDSREHAYSWALNVKKLRPSEIVVIQALIKLGRCLDLLHNPAHASLLENYFNEAENRVFKNNLKSRKYSQEQISITESVVIDLIHRDTPIDTVRTSFSSGKPIFPGSRFTRGQQIIICVRNLESILDVEKAQQIY